VLIVCHGGTSQLLLEMLLEENENISESENCSISIVEVRNNTIELVKFNDISYLK
jgi:broad specificity phosphatase PhoE